MKVFDWYGLIESLSLWWEQIDYSYMLIFIGITVAYIAIRPFINWIVSSKSVKLLNYVMVSLLFLVFFLGGMILTTMFRLSLLEVTLHSLAAFGGCLIIVHGLQWFLVRKKKRV
ncbi:hypothetical protein [Lentibacillus sp. CBA3610]|uniref:hypothetical protein n=1 Tax=Lentibacillus sp. CBA3610 TaxID=2518176 RepID=UPI0015957E19|nr:hypothetical protein [Lentibacillus sp. CBA3610]QKY68896.1 hypothetical protein Len3610_04010 [Lentibacillus sp. CBA3610]